MSSLLLIAVLAVATLSFALNAGYIIHELGWYPHTKDRSRPTVRTIRNSADAALRVKPTHDFQVSDGLTDVVRRFGHKDIYNIADPYQALETVIRRYEQQPTRSRYDDLVHVSNYVCNNVKCDKHVNTLIDRVHVLMHSTTLRSGDNG
jgi:hypothetical protein